jgi:hypothetical protein
VAAQRLDQPSPHPPRHPDTWQQDCCPPRAPPVPNKEASMRQSDETSRVRFSRRRVWRWLSSGMLQWIHRPDDGGSKHLWDVGQFLPDYTALHPRRQPSPHVLLHFTEDKRGCRFLSRKKIIFHHWQTLAKLWDLRFSRWRVWRRLSSRLLLRLVKVYRRIRGACCLHHRGD